MGAFGSTKIIQQLVEAPAGGEGFALAASATIRFLRASA
jgi:hypothetical protein